jgi:glycosyltransferase involved in cell wall biosynthesis
MERLPRLAIVVPCYNEEEAFPFCLESLNNVLHLLIIEKLIGSNSYILFSDDGSKDKTWHLIEEAADQHATVKGLKLSTNKGHQIALIAGLQHADADITVSIDADLQDDTAAIEKMVREYLAGNDVVYGVRQDRQTDSRFKRKTAELFYTIMAAMGVKQVSNHADFRLLSRRASDALLQYKEQNVYIRGLVPLVGFQSSKIYYSRSVRVAGESKYPLRKMLSLALEGITSLTITPLRLIALTGLIISLVSVMVAIYTLVEKIIGNTVEGWASVMIAIFFLGGIQMLSLGVIGEYIGKIYMESKQRPKYFTDKLTENFDDK